MTEPMTLPKSDFLRVLTERGFIHQCSDLAGLDEKAASGELIAYIGFDCTAASLHVGSLLQIMLLRWWQKCGHTPNRRVIPLEDMVQKIKVAVDSRSSADFLIIARTDSRTGLGIDEALRRGEAFAKAGADVVFIESPETEEEMERIARTIPAPVFANLVHGGRTPMLPRERLQELGFAIAIYPALGFLATGAALESAYRELHDLGRASGSVPMYDFQRFNELLGFQDVWDFDRKWASESGDK